MGAMIGNRAGVKNPATDGLTFLDKAASLGNPPALTELGKLLYMWPKKDLGLAYTHCAASQGYAPASYELGAYYKIVEHNFPKALVYYQVSVSQGARVRLFSYHESSEVRLPCKCNVVRPRRKVARSVLFNLQKLEADPDLRFPNLIEDYPLPPHPTQGYDADRLDWKPER